MFKQRNKINKDKSENVKIDSTTEPTKSHNTKTKEKKFSQEPIQSSKGEKTIIGENVIIDGNIRGTGDLVIEGLLKGNVELEKNSLTIGSKGRVEGEIVAHDVVMGGRMHGKIKALGKVDITQKADFYGEVKANSISIENGAFFKGEIELDRKPHKGEEPDGKPMNKPGDKQNNASDLQIVESS